MPARIKGKNKVSSSENFPRIKKKAKFVARTKRKISNSLNLISSNNEGQEKNLRSRTRNLNNSKSNDSSRSSDDSLMNNDGVITRTVFRFTPPKNIKKSKISIDTLSKHELVIDKLLEKNHKKIKQLIDEIPTKNTRTHKLNQHLNKSNEDNPHFIANIHSNKIKTQNSLRSKSRPLKEKNDKKEMRVVIEKSNRIDNLIKIKNVNDLDIPNKPSSEDEALINKFETSSNNTEISSLENFLLTDVPYENGFEYEQHINLLEENRKSSSKLDSSLTEFLHSKNQQISFQSQDIAYSTENGASLLEGIDYEAGLIFENDFNGNLFQNSNYTSENQISNEYVDIEDKFSSFYEKHSENSMLETIEGIIKENNLELQLHIQGYVYKITSIKSLICILSSLDKRKKSIINSNGSIKTVDYKDLFSKNLSNIKVFENNNKKFDSYEKDFILESAINNEEEHDKYRANHFDHVSSLNLTNDDSFKIADNINSNDSTRHDKNENNILLSNAVEESKENNKIICTPPLTDIENNNLISKRSINNSMHNSISNAVEESKENNKIMGTPPLTDIENNNLISKRSINNSILKEDEIELVTRNNQHTMEVSEAENIKLPDITKTDLNTDKTNKNYENDINFVPGSIFWARVSSFPYWPCIVFPDSENQVIKRIGRGNFNSIHVRFFADNGRFAWVNKSNFMPYYGKNEFLGKANELQKKRRKTTRRHNPFNITHSQQDIWNQACQEADIFVLKPIEIRLNKFNAFLEESTKSLRAIKKRKMKSLNMVSQGKGHESGTSSFTETNDFMLVKRQKIDSDIKKDTISFKNFCNEIKWLIGSSIDEGSQINVYINGLWQHRQYNLSKRGSNRAKIIADNKVMNILEVSSKIKKFDPVAAEPKKERPKKSKSVPIEETIEDILKLSKNHLFQNLKKEVVCHVCLTPSQDQTIKCITNNCPNWMHIKCAGDIKSDNKNILFDSIEKKTFDDKIEILCNTCKNGTHLQCFVCKEYDFDQEVKKEYNNENSLVRCRLNQCGKYFHQKCLRYWPQARLSISENKVELICPSHVCQTCISDDPRINYIKCFKLIKCVKCPSSYHIDSQCIPAGTVFLTKTDIICPRHEMSKRPVCNTDWCFMCSKLGNLICCETCPSSFHLECLKLSKIPDDGYICEQCESGRMPLYGEMVWAKHGSYRYWPGIIIPPKYVPLPVQRITHQKFSFCVRFFGSHDHSWLNHHRVYLYQDDDWRYISNNFKSNKMYSLAIQESHKISEFLKAKKIELNIQDKVLPFVLQPYSKILYNRPVPPVKLQEISSEYSTCNCDPKEENPCSLYSKCINRICYTECHPKLCLSGEKCGNQMFEKRQYAPVNLLRTKSKGFGLFSENFIPSGTFIIEYVGELINDAELRRRIDKKIKEKDEVFYFLNLSNNITIDAGPKGNLSRFMNHSCDPNCEAQPWIVNGHRRIGLFAINDIPSGTELTFHYNLECYGESLSPCLCGSENCTGFIGTITKKAGKNLNKVTDLENKNN